MADSLLVVLASRKSRTLALALTLAAASVMAVGIVRSAVSDDRARRATTLAELARAVAWEPGNPHLRLRLGSAHQYAVPETDLGRARAHLEAALRQRPAHATTWFHLARLADREGDRGRARRALDTAIGLGPHEVGVRWEAALLALQWGERDAALAHLRYVLAVDPSRRDVAFQVARSLLGPGEPLASLLPSEPGALTAILRTAIRQREAELAGAAWERRVHVAPPLEDELKRGYIETLLAAGQARLAREAWLTVSRASNGAGATPADVLWNGGFEADRLVGWGFDWQIQRVWGVEVGLDRRVAARGRQSLRLAFNAFPTLDFAGVFQNVAVEPGREYHLRALARSLDHATQSGVKLQVVVADSGRVLAETPAVTGTREDWISLEARARVPGGITLVRVRVRREPSPGPDANLGGKVWIDDVTLTPLPAGLDDARGRT